MAKKKYKPPPHRLKVYDADVGKPIALERALRKMTDEWVDAGMCCSQTTIDLLAACRELLHQRAVFYDELCRSTTILEGQQEGGK